MIADDCRLIADELQNMQIVKRLNYYYSVEAGLRGN